MVTLTCDIQETGDWRYSWNKNRNQNYIVGQDQKYIITSVDWSHRGVYRCKGSQSKAPTYSQMSDGVTLTVSDKLWPTLTVNPQSPVFTGDTVTLSCDVGQSTGWTIHWRKDSNTEYIDTATKTIESVSVSDGGNYWCRAQRGNYYSEFSKTAEIKVKLRPKPVVDVHPDRSVFRGETVTLTCDIQEKGDWRYSWYKDNNQVNSAGQNQNYIISSVDWSHSGVYSCEGRQSNAPQYSQMSDGVTLTVSAASSSPRLVTGVVVGLSVCLLIFISLLLLWRYKKNKDQQRNISQTSVPNQSGEFQMENSPLQSDSDQIYDDVAEVNKRDRDPELFPEVTYSEITVKKNVSVNKDDTMAELNYVTYSELRTKVKKCENKGADAGVKDAIYAQPIRKKGPRVQTTDG